MIKGPWAIRSHALGTSIYQEVEKKLSDLVRRRASRSTLTLVKRATGRSPQQFFQDLLDERRKMEFNVGFDLRAVLDALYGYHFSGEHYIYRPPNTSSQTIRKARIKLANAWQAFFEDNTNNRRALKASLREGIHVRVSNQESIDPESVYEHIADEQLMLEVGKKIPEGLTLADFLESLKDRRVNDFLHGKVSGIDNYTTGDGMKFTHLLAELNSLPFVQTKYSCAGHPGRMHGSAYLTLSLEANDPRSEEFVSHLIKLKEAFNGSHDRNEGFGRYGSSIEHTFHFSVSDEADQHRLWTQVKRIADQYHFSKNEKGDLVCHSCQKPVKHASNFCGYCGNFLLATFDKEKAFQIKK